MSQMKCPNCGAQMDVHPDKDFQFCSYCGTKVEKKDVPPETLAGAIYGIGKEWIRQKNHVETDPEYLRHLERMKEKEIAESKRNDKITLGIVIGCVVLVIAVIMLTNAFH